MKSCWFEWANNCKNGANPLWLYSGGPSWLMHFPLQPAVNRQPGLLPGGLVEQNSLGLIKFAMPLQNVNFLFYKLDYNVCFIPPALVRLNLIRLPASPLQPNLEMITSMLNQPILIQPVLLSSHNPTSAHFNTSNFPKINDPRQTI